MALKRITDYDAASTPLAGTELLELDVAGVPKKCAVSSLPGGSGFDGSALTGINAQTGTNYTPVLADAGKNIRCTNASAITVTIPPASSVAYAANTVLYVSQGGAGAVSIAAGSGVTVNNPNSTATTAKGTWLAIVNVGADEWDVV